MTATASDCASKLSDSQATHSGRMSLIFYSFLLLVFMGLVIRLCGFSQLCRLVKRWPTRNKGPKLGMEKEISSVCLAIETATTLTLSIAYCLRRAAATTCLLRCRGVPAQLVIGVRRLPFSAHSWVEVNGQLIGSPAFSDQGLRVIDRM